MWMLSLICQIMKEGSPRGRNRTTWGGNLTTMRYARTLLTARLPLAAQLSCVLPPKEGYGCKCDG